MCAVWHLASSAQPLTIPIVPVHAASLTRRRVQTLSWVIPSLGSAMISRARHDCLRWAAEHPQPSILSRASATVPYDSAVPTPFASGARVLRHCADTLGMTASVWTKESNSIILLLLYMYPGGQKFGIIQIFNAFESLTKSQLSEVSLAHQGYIYLIKNTLKTVISWNIITICKLFFIWTF